MKEPNISIIVPMFNEEEMFDLLINRLNKLVESTSIVFEIILIDDGSTDSTSKLMENMALQNETYKCIFLSRNYGHQIALSAGLNEVSATEAVLLIDADLQDPPELFHDFYDKYKEGYDVVYSVRKRRKENVLKRTSYYLFYRLINAISYYKIPLDSGDFSLISRRVVNLINQMPEQDRFLRGLRSWVGFKQIGIEYERQERAAGEPKYRFKELFKLALTGIFNFSYIPIRLVTFLQLRPQGHLD